jgi:hypothetical protein
MAKKDISSKEGIIGIIVFVFLLVVGMVYAQNTYSNKLKSITISVYSPPIETGQTIQEIIITKDDCKYTITNLNDKTTKNQECSVLKGGFNKIQNDANSYALIDKLQTPALKSEEDIKQGGVYTVTAELNNGDKYSLDVDSQFTSAMQPLLKDLQLYAPKLSDFGLVQENI